MQQHSFNVGDKVEFDVAIPGLPDAPPVTMPGIVTIARPDWVAVETNGNPWFFGAHPKAIDWSLSVLRPANA